MLHKITRIKLFLHSLLHSSGIVKENDHAYEINLSPTYLISDNSKPAAIQPATHLESKGQSSSAVALKAILDPLLIILSIHLSGQITWR